MLMMIAAAVRAGSIATTVTPHSVAHTQQQAAEEASARWGLTSQEWTAYERIMRHRRGVWSPGLDPITALGVSADTTAERDRFAELYVRTEFERTRKELAFQLSVDRAWARLYPDAPRLSPQPVIASTDDTAQRYALIVTPDCTECEGVIARRLAGMLTEAAEGVDIHVVGTTGDDATLRAWIAGQPALLRALNAGKATVNHGGQFEDLASFPAIYRKTGEGQWIREL
tara:strand:+ start:4394 stop:5077 length:684 start_codon:yes stop_codon:yes gene_type:complete